jgi:hypothetical protein
MVKTEDALTSFDPPIRYLLDLPPQEHLLVVVFLQETVEQRQQLQLHQYLL